MASPDTNSAITEIADRMDRFEAGASVANTGTGSRREGDDFERLVATFWSAVATHCVDQGADSALVSGPRSRTWRRLTAGQRSMYVPSMDSSRRDLACAPEGWLDLDFSVDDLIDAYPGRSNAVDKYAPTAGPFAGGNYLDQFSKMKTKFDDTIVLEDAGVMSEKIVLEYKTAKSSKGRQIDGNAHERLSFQIMQYLEIATMYTRCSLVVMTNGAFARYRNKYHVNFHIQADRLSAFPWFSMDHLSTSDEYLRFVGRMVDWLFDTDTAGAPTTP